MRRMKWKEGWGWEKWNEESEKVENKLRRCVEEGGGEMKGVEKSNKKKKVRGKGGGIDGEGNVYEWMQRGIRGRKDKVKEEKVRFLVLKIRFHFLLPRDARSRIYQIF